MPILFRCSCGKQLRAQDELAGRRMKCPACASVLAIPNQVTLEKPPSTVARPTMVKFPCACGKHLQARRAYAGQMTKCPRCGAELLIPESNSDQPPLPDADVVEMTEVPEPARERRPGRQTPPPRQRRLLWPWITAASVLLAGGAFALWFFVLRDTSKPLPEADHLTKPVADLDWVPADGLGFMSVQVGNWWTGPAGRKVQQQLAALNPGAYVEKVLGVSPAQIKRVTFVFSNPQSAYVVVATSRPYDQAKFLAWQMPNARKELIRGETIYVPSSSPPAMGPGRVNPRPNLPANTAPSPGAAGMAFYPVSKQLFIVGALPTIRALVERPPSPSKQGPLSEGLLLTDKHLVVAALNVGAADIQAAKQRAPAEFKPFLPLLEARTVVFTTDLSEELRMDLRLTFPNAALAAKGQKSAQAAITLAREQIGEVKKKIPPAQAEMAKPVFHLAESMLRSVTVERENEVVRVHLQTEQGTAAMAMGALAPAVQKVRDAANRAASQNNLKQLALAMHNYAGTYGGQLPPAVFRGGLSWRVALLPFVEQGDLYRQFHLDEPWNSPHNIKLVSRMPKVFAPPGEVQTKEPNQTFYQVFVGPKAPFNGGLAPRMPGSFTDGTSQTILIAEAGQAVTWTKPEDIPFDSKGKLPKLGGIFPGGFNLAMADGAVRFIPRTVSENTLRSAITPAAGDVLGADWPK